MIGTADCDVGDGFLSAPVLLQVQDAPATRAHKPVVTYSGVPSRHTDVARHSSLPCDFNQRTWLPCLIASPAKIISRVVQITMHGALAPQHRSGTDVGGAGVSRRALASAQASTDGARLVSSFSSISFRVSGQELLRSTNRWQNKRE